MILGGIALMLYGVQQVRDGVMQALGAQLRTFIERSTRLRVQALAAGVVVTSLIQSSNATALIVSGFAQRGLISIVSALAVVLGSDIGVAIVVQVLSIGVSSLGPIFVFVGMVIIGWFPLSRAKHAGTAIVGLGLVLLGLGTITHAAQPMQHSEVVNAIVHALSNDLPMAFLVGMVLAWLSQSATAIVLLIMSFVGAGTVALDAAFALILGTHVGSTIGPLLMYLKIKDETRIIMWGSFLIRFFFCVGCLPFVDTIVQHASMLAATPERQVVNFHAFFSIARALIFLPFLAPIAKFLCRAFPKEINNNDLSKPRYLDDRDVATPSVALSAATRESLHLGDLVLKMLNDVRYLFETHDARAVQILMDDDNNVDRLYEKIKIYLAQVSRETMTPAQAKRHVDILMFIINLEHIGDIIVKNLCELAQKKWRNNLKFSKQGWEEISSYHDHVCENFRLAMNVFQSGEMTLARQLVQNKEALRRATASTSGSHFERLRQGLLESLGSSSVHLDVIRDLRRINDHLTSTAYDILEEGGALQSRLKD